jgi:hypothetical protein
LNSTTLSPVARVRLKDPNGNDALLPDDGTASPTVGPNGDVFFGVLENPFPYNHDRGWLLHFNGSLSQQFLPGAFGWDDTPSIVPASMVPSYSGSASYLLMTKYNDYAGVNGSGNNRLAILDPTTGMRDPITGQTVMKEVLTISGPTPDPEFPNTPGAVREWCINAAAVDVATKSILANSEDGKFYRWDLTTNTFTQVVTLTSGVGEAYTPTAIGPDGTAYAINNGTLFAVRQGTSPTRDLNWQGGSITGPTASTTATTFTVNRTYTLTGPTTAAAFTIAYYASRDAIFGNADDLLIGSETVPAGLAAGTYAGTSTPLQIPAAGTFYLFAMLDGGNTIQEIDETNNVAQAPQQIVVSAVSASATFLGTDTATQGSWQGAYGAQGYSVVNDTTSYPSYAQVSVTGAGTYTWAASTTDVRALQKAANPSDRIAATYYSFTNFTIDANLTDGAAHKVALYLLDWDSYLGGRSERIDVVDVATGTVLDTHSITNFSAGEYLGWNLKGHVQFRVTNTGSNQNTCLVSGLFFDPQAPVASAAFVGTDTATQGSWQGVYGAQGYSVVGDNTSYPTYAQVSVTGANTFVWASSTTDVRALQKPSNPSDRIAATYYSFTSFTIDVNLTDSAQHRLGLYLLDWDNSGRSERIDVVDAATGIVLDTHNVTSFSAGEYLTWNLRGHVQFKVTNTGPGSTTAVVSGLLFDAPAPSSAAAFLGTDQATQGSWQGVYGSQGYSVVNDATSYPSYAQVNVSGAGTYTWAASTSDVRGLQKATNPNDRIAATYYSFTNFTIDVNITDGGTHRMGVYLLDWDSYLGGRSERIDVVDAATGTVLDTRSVTNFSAGEYLGWNLKGHVQFRVTNTGSSQNTCLVSGLFFDPQGAASSATFVGTNTTTQGNWQGAVGSQGYNVVGDNTSYPTYAQVGVTAASTLVWASSTTDVRALQKASNPSDRIAAALSSATSFTIDVNLTDGAQHRLGLYLLDWDNAGRSERVDVLDVPTGIVLDTRSVSGFSAGEYLTWNLRGHVQFKVTNTGPGSTTAVVSGLFFDPLAPSSTAAFLGTDTATQGSWQGAYGSQGYSVVNDTTSYPSYAQVSVTGAGTYTWAASTTDVRALQKAANPGDRIAATYYSFTNFTIDVNFTDTAQHKVALYLLDWDSYLGGRSERIDVVDAATGTVLDTHSITNFSAGEYLAWDLKGHIQFRVTNTGSSNNTALVSGLFFDPQGTAGSATFVGTNTTTQGSWQGVFGAQGYNIVGDSASYPAYAQVGVSGNSTTIWASSTSDVRALQKATNPSDRIAAAWSSATSFTIDVNLTDNALHRLGVYLLDWDNASRSERIDVVDVATGIVMDTRTVSSFSAGEYLGWNLKGHVQLRVTNTNPNTTAVVSGLFFDVPAPTSSATFLTTNFTTQGSWQGVYGSQGYSVVNDATSYPTYAQVNVTGAGTYTWVASTSDVRALQKATNPNDRIASTYYSFTNFTIDVNLTDTAQHRVAAYLLDWDSYLGGRSERIDVLDAATGTVLDTHTITSFSAGEYLVWNLKGHVRIQVTNTGSNQNTCLLSGLFFG